jgi:arylsulfatase A-like enzyme
VGGVVASEETAFGGVIGRTYRDSRPWWPDEAGPPDGAPNVAFIVLDDVGFADLGCYGSEIRTPTMDRLAAGGLRYTNFHTTAMCSPTRACLLTGRNAHSVGMGIIAEWSTGFPAYRGRLSRRAATLAEVLGANGYSTFAAGKWHLMPMDDATAAGPFDDWPIRRGFDRWYGFHGALANSWHPELFEDNHAIDPPAAPEDGYHLTDDLVDRSIGMIRDRQAVAPERPFFLYLALGAAHWPHHVPREYIERYRGRYDRGWDAVREERLARQVALGIVPEGTTLAPRNPDVRAWADLADDERRLFARMQEVYAGFVEHTDAQLGRLVAYLEAVGELDDTLIVLLSDNGSSPEGGAVGAVNARKHLQYEPETVSDNLEAIDRLGDPTTYPHYPTGWAMASNTPLKWYKKDVHAGGVRDPLIVHWPARIADRGGLRGQFHHVVDVMPTVLDLIGIAPPSEYAGVPQMPVHGTSMAYTLDAPDAPTRKPAQYFELLGDRAIWHGGWKAVARHERGADFEHDRWELYHLDADVSESRDLAAEHPEKLRELVERWWTEAGRYGALPLDDREYERVAERVASRARAVSTYYPGMARIDRFSAPDVTDRSYTIEADATISEGGAEGVLLQSGARFGGYVLYVQDGRLIHEYAFSERERTRLASDVPVPSGRVTLRYTFRRTGRRRGIGTLSIGERDAGSAELPKTWPVVAVTGGLTCGRAGSAPVTDAFRPPFAFTGVLHRVTVTVADDAGEADAEGAARAALAEE